MSEYVNQHELRVIGMSRSGNHAILNWIMAQARGRVCFLNCTEPKNNPYYWARPLDNEIPYRVNYQGFSLEREQVGEFSPKDWLIFSHEDCFLGSVASRQFEEHHDEWVGPSKNRLDLLILRDPFNLFASRLKTGYGGLTRKATVRVWKQHAREFLGQQRWLPRNRVTVSYNEWVRNRDYRQQVAEQLGLEFTDAGIDRVARTGAGSSFDGLNYDGRALQMPVFDRWRAFAKDKAFLSMLDEEVFELAEEAFGRMPHVSRLRKSISAPRVLTPRTSRQVIRE